MADNLMTVAELAEQTGSTIDRVWALVEVGVLRPQRIDRPLFDDGDIARVLVAGAMEDAGLTLELMRRGINAGVVSYAQTDQLYPPVGRLAGTVEELAQELGVGAPALLRVITAFGLPRPDPGARLRAPDMEQLGAFVSAWLPLGGEEVVVRAARIYGDALRRAAEGWMELFDEVVMAPIADQALQWEDMRRHAVEPGLPVLAVGRTLLSWLHDHFRVQMLNQMNFEAIERELALLGVVPAAVQRPAGIVFADLANYTHLTEEQGDEAAVSVATRLAEVAEQIAQAHAGRLVKLLGDGVMLHFPVAEDGVRAALALRAAMAPAGLPPAHIGVSMGTVIRRESDYFGGTVNVASRLSAQAGPDEILVTAELARASGSAGTAEPMPLKGIASPVPVVRL